MDPDADLSILDNVLKLEIDIASENIQLSTNFYEIAKPILGKYIDLFDPVGNSFHVQLFISKTNVMMWEVIPQLVQFYGLTKTHFMYLKYNADHDFLIEIKDEEDKDIIYPNPNAVGIGRNEVIVISSESEEEGDGAADEVEPPIVELNAEIVDVPEDVEEKNEAPGPDDVVQIDLDDDVAHGHGEMAQAVVKDHPWFEKTMTTSQASGRQPLRIPFDFVKEFINCSWDVLVMHAPNGRNYNCKLWSKRKDDECLLGGEWYHVVKAIHLEEGDTVKFATVMEGINYVNATVVRGR